MEKLGPHWTDFHEIWYLSIFRITVQKIQVSLKYDKNNGYFTWIPVHIFIMPRSFFLIMRNVSHKICRENQNAHLCSVTYFRKSFHLWDNVENYCRAGQATDDNMHIVCWTPKATNMRSEYVTLIIFPRQEWLYEHAWMSRLCVYCLSCSVIVISINVISYELIVGFLNTSQSK